MFGIIRLIAGCIIWAIAFLLLTKKRFSYRYGRYIVATAIAVVLTLPLAFVPLENIFLTFDSPSAAYKYYNFGKSEVNLVVDGCHSDLVVGSKNNTDVYLVVPKTTDGWKVGVGFNTKKVTQKIVKDVAIHVYQYANTNDYFIAVLDIKGQDLTISDSNNSSFLIFEHMNNSLGKTFAAYYTSFSNLEEYWLDINGEKIYFSTDF